MRQSNELWWTCAETVGEVIVHETSGERTRKALGDRTIMYVAINSH